MTTPLPETSHAEGAISAAAPPNYRGGRRDLTLGVVIGVAVSAVLLLPAMISAFGGGDIFPALTESGLTVVLVLVGIVVVIWAFLDGIPAWRNRTPRVPAEVAR
jgi:hypothetical protein